MSVVHEVCSCGAKFDYTAQSDGWNNPEAECRLAAKQWREQHHHPLWPVKPAPVETNAPRSTSAPRRPI